jgi:hypothetical protein
VDPRRNILPVAVDVEHGMAKAKPRRLQPRQAPVGVPVTRAIVEEWERGAPAAAPFDLAADRDEINYLDRYFGRRDYGPSDVLSPSGARCYVEIFNIHERDSLGAAEGLSEPAYSTLGKSSARARRHRGRTRRVRTRAPAEGAGGSLVAIGSGDFAALRDLPPQVRRVVEGRRRDLRVACETSSAPGAVGELLSHLAERGICYELCDCCLGMVTAAVQGVDAWCRDPSDWVYCGAGGHAAGGLVAHLLQRYPVPKWLAPDQIYPMFQRIVGPPFVRQHAGHTLTLHAWYVHLAVGGSLRTLPGLGFPLSRKAAHFAATYAGTDVEPHWVPLLGRCVAHGLDEALGREVARRGGGRWVPGRLADVLDWAAREGPTVDEFNRVLDYLLAGHRRRLGRRSLATMLREAERWMQDPDREAYRDMVWLPCGIGALEGHRSASGHDWDIVELCSSADLREESDRMSNCVRSYDDSANSGSCAIFSLRQRERSEAQGTSSLATIEVNLWTGSLTQVRGRFNSRVDGEREACIRAWATSVKLSASPTAF